MTIKETEVGKRYWVNNGNWWFEVISKTDTHTKIFIEYTEREVDISNDTTEQKLNISTEDEYNGV